MIGFDVEHVHKNKTSNQYFTRYYECFAAVIDTALFRIPPKKNIKCSFNLNYSNSVKVTCNIDHFQMTPINGVDLNRQLLCITFQVNNRNSGLIRNIVIVRIYIYIVRIF